MLALNFGVMSSIHKPIEALHIVRYSYILQDGNIIQFQGIEMPLYHVSAPL